MNIFHFPTSVAICASLLTVSLTAASCARPDPSERLKPLVERYVHAWNTGDFDGLAEIVSSEFELRMSPRFDPIRGLDSLRNSITYWRTAYPNFHIDLDELIYAPNVVTARWTIRATNSGPGAHPPTGKTVVVPGVSIIHVSADKIVDEWIAGNDLYWAQQLGFTLTSASANK